MSSFSGHGPRRMRFPPSISIFGRIDSKRVKSLIWSSISCSLTDPKVSIYTMSAFFSISKMFLASFMAFELGVYMANVYDADCEKQMQSTNLHRD